MEEEKHVVVESEDAKCRYAIGKIYPGKGKILIVFGLNPSRKTIIKNGEIIKMGPTTRKIDQSVLKNKKYRGWLLFNLCPICELNPKNLDSSPHFEGKEKDWCGENLIEIKKNYNGVKKLKNVVVLAAWGSNISEKAYEGRLIKSLKAIVEKSGLARKRWVRLKKLTKKNILRILATVKLSLKS